LNLLSVIARPNSFFGPNAATTTNDISHLTQLSRSWTLEPNISYTKGLNRFGDITVKLGGTLQRQFNSITRIESKNAETDIAFTNPTTLFAAENISTRQTDSENRYLGFFGILNYNYENRYLINLKIWAGQAFWKFWICWFRVGFK